MYNQSQFIKEKQYNQSQEIQLFKCKNCKDIIFLNKNIGSQHLKYAILCFSIVFLNIIAEFFISDNKNKSLKLLHNTLRLFSHFNILLIFYLFNNYIFQHQATHFDEKFENFSKTIYLVLTAYFSIMLFVNIFEYYSNGIISCEQMQFVVNKDLILLTHSFLGLFTLQNLYHVSSNNYFLSIAKMFS